MYATIYDGNTRIDINDENLRAILLASTHPHALALVEVLGIKPGITPQGAKLYLRTLNRARELTQNHIAYSPTYGKWAVEAVRQEGAHRKINAIKALRTRSIDSDLPRLGLAEAKALIDAALELMK